MSNSTFGWKNQINHMHEFSPPAAPQWFGGDINGRSVPVESVCALFAVNPKWNTENICAAMKTVKACGAYGSVLSAWRERPVLPLLQRQAGRSFFCQPSPRVSPQSAPIHQRNTRSSNIVRPRVEQRIRSIGAGSSTPRKVSALKVQPPGANNARLSFRSPQRQSSDA